MRGVGPHKLCLSSARREHSKSASLAACASVMYSASIVKRVTVGCFLEDQLIKLLY